MPSDHETEEVYDEVELEDFVYDSDRGVFTYPCPCGDEFEITEEALIDGSDDIAKCPSCSLQIKVIYDKENLATKLAALNDA